MGNNIKAPIGTNSDAYLIKYQSIVTAISQYLEDTPTLTVKYNDFGALAVEKWGAGDYIIKTEIPTSRAGDIVIFCLGTDATSIPTIPLSNGLAIQGYYQLAVTSWEAAPDTYNIAIEFMCFNASFAATELSAIIGSGPGEGAGPRIYVPEIRLYTAAQ